MLGSIRNVGDIGKGEASIDLSFNKLARKSSVFKLLFEVILEAPNPDEQVDEVVFELFR